MIKIKIGLFRCTLIFILISNCSKEQNPVWQELSIPGHSTVDAVNFLNENFGIATIFFGNVIVTRDGGTRWEVFDVLENENFISSFIYNEDTFYVGRNRLFMTNDGGESFQELGIGQVDGHATSWQKNYSIETSGRDLKFVNEDIGYFTTIDKIYATDDGGESWTLEFESDRELFDIEVDVWHQYL